MNRSTCCEGKINTLPNGWEQCGACGNILNEHGDREDNPRVYKPINMPKSNIRATVPKKPKPKPKVRTPIKPSELSFGHIEPVISPETLANKRVFEDNGSKRYKVPVMPPMKRL